MELGLRTECGFRPLAVVPHDLAICDDNDEIAVFWWSPMRSVL